MALKVLEDDSSDHHLPQLCDCNTKEGEMKPGMDIEDGEQEGRDSEGNTGGLVEDPVQKDETEEGFAVLGQRLVEEREGRTQRAEIYETSSDMDISDDEKKCDSQ